MTEPIKSLCQAFFDAVDMLRMLGADFWSPPGCGKTSLAHVIQQKTKKLFVALSAVSSGVKEVKEVLADARQVKKLGQNTILFIDEIHRFNKGQQDALLGAVEDGTVTLIGATSCTEDNSCGLCNDKNYAVCEGSTKINHCVKGAPVTDVCEDQLAGSQCKTYSDVGALCKNNKDDYILFNSSSSAESKDPGKNPDVDPGEDPIEEADPTACHESTYKTNCVDRARIRTCEDGKIVTHLCLEYGNIGGCRDDETYGVGCDWKWAPDTVPDIQKFIKIDTAETKFKDGSRFKMTDEDCDETYESTCTNLPDDDPENPSVGVVRACLDGKVATFIGTTSCCMASTS